MKIIVATKNEGKVREISRILGNVEVVSQTEAGIDVEVEETGSSFAENALIKAHAVSMLCDYPVLADDSGLCVDVLDGRPGIYSARYGGDITFKEKINKLLLEMEGQTNRKAHFECVMALVFPDGREMTARGICQGRILEKPEGEKGFGFDPIFYSDELKCGFAVCTDEEKNSVSHRGKALSELKKMLKEED